MKPKPLKKRFRKSRRAILSPYAYVTISNNLNIPISPKLKAILDDLWADCPLTEAAFIEAVSEKMRR